VPGAARVSIGCTGPIFGLMLALTSTGRVTLSPGGFEPTSQMEGKEIRQNLGVRLHKLDAYFSVVRLMWAEIYDSTRRFFPGSRIAKGDLVVRPTASAVTLPSRRVH
jgi:hypothetical protein